MNLMNSTNLKNSFNSYLASLDSWMKYYGFEAFSGGEGYHFDRMYHKKSTEISRFGTVDYYAEVKIFDGNIRAEDFQAFSIQSFNYAEKIRKGPPLGFGGMLVCFPLIVLEKIPMDVYNLLITYCPKHWASVEFPCVLDIETSNLYYYEKTPVWGMAYYDTHRKQVYQYFSPKSWQSVSESSKTSP